MAGRATHSEPHLLQRSQLAASLLKLPLYAIGKLHLGSHQTQYMREGGRSEAMQETMIEIILFVMAIASAASLLLVSPWKARRKLLCALRRDDVGGTVPAFEY